MEYPRDSHAIVERQVREDLSRNDSAFLFYAYDEDIERNDGEKPPIVLCEACGLHTQGQLDGELITGDCEHCGEQFAYSKDDARVMEVLDE